MSGGERRRPPVRRAGALDWAPPGYRVDDRGKVEGSVNQRKPNNWGRWGDVDEIGTANHITPPAIAEAAALITTGRVISCALPLGGETPVHPTRLPSIHFFRFSGTDLVAGGRVGRQGQEFQGTDDYLIVPVQGSTQWDGLAHVGVGDTLYNGFWVGNVEGYAGAKRCSVELLADRMVGRGVLVDIARHRGAERVPGGTHITVGELDECLAAEGVTVKPGDMLLVRTGHLAHYYQLRDKSSFWSEGAPGLGADFTAWAYEREIAAVATDTLAVEVEPSPDGTVFPLHIRLIRDLGLVLGEMWWLEELAEACASDGRFAFFLSAPPVPVANGVGAMVNPVAIK
jgi:kynurenine formamidase